MATVFYDFAAATNGSGTAASPKNTWANPGNGDSIGLRRGDVFARTSQLNLSTFSGLTFFSWFYEDGSDEPLMPKPIITGTTTSSSLVNVQGTGVHVFRNIRFAEIRHPSNPAAASPSAVNFGPTGTQDASDGASGEFHACEFVGINGNAISFNGITSSTYASFAAPRCVVRHCLFDDIGHDAVFAKVKTYFEVGYCRMTRLSQRTTTGDGVGFLDANPAFAWVHHNYIERTNNDYKQCIMIDGVDNSGYALIEENELIGYGSATVSAELNVVVNLDQVQGVIRRNKIVTYGIGISFNVDAVEVYSNQIIVGNYRSMGDATIGVSASNAKIENNTFICLSSAGLCIKTGTGRSGNSIRNNCVVGAGVFYQRGASSSETRSNNLFWQTTTPYQDSALAAIALTGSDLTADPLLSASYRPTVGSPLLGAGTHLGYRRDLDGKQRRNPPCIGAYDTATMIPG